MIELLRVFPGKRFHLFQKKTHIIWDHCWFWFSSARLSDYHAVICMCVQLVGWGDGVMGGKPARLGAHRWRIARFLIAISSCTTPVFL